MRTHLPPEIARARGDAVPEATTDDTEGVVVSTCNVAEKW